MAKRSPILGYNHNVRYRGLVFHVQTEDSGVLSPHLFTHLFHAGVIVSTRKLVYDAGAAEEAIKSLMQAQHKAVLKDLRRGHFDDKIDEYLGGTPGLLPREEKPAPATAPASAPVSAPASADPAAPLVPDESGVTRRDIHSASTAPTLATIADATQPQPARTQTAERRSAPSTVRTTLPAGPPPRPAELDATTGAVAAAVAAANNATIRTPAIHDANPESAEIQDSSPEIEIQLVADEPSEPARTRTARDTDVADIAPDDLPADDPRPTTQRLPSLDEHTRPTVDISRVSDGIPGAIAAASASRIHQAAPGSGRPPSAVGAATLPPVRPIARPPSRPSITPPQVVTRPVSDASGARKTDSIEIYAPPPPSVEPPPGERKAGQYAQHKRSGKVPVTEDGARDRPPPIPPGLGRPGKAPPARSVAPPIPVRRPEPTQPMRSRPPTPTRSSGPSRAANPSSGVVMTRPAVIVGAPAKPAGPRVRKAREEEGRGFGHGLISEKSLDEVILAYLSEDADDK